MTIKELADITHSQIKIISARNGKVLCHQFYEEKHKYLSKREVISVWSEILTNKNGGYYNYARPIICVYVSEVSQ